MIATKQIDIMLRMDAMIRGRRTGPPQYFGDSLGISERQVRQYIEELRGLGADVKYSRSARSYIYPKGGKLIATLKFEK